MLTVDTISHEGAVKVLNKIADHGTCPDSNGLPRRKCENHDDCRECNKAAFIEYAKED